MTAPVKCDTCAVLFADDVAFGRHKVKNGTVCRTPWHSFLVVDPETMIWSVRVRHVRKTRSQKPLHKRPRGGLHSDG